MFRSRFLDLIAAPLLMPLVLAYLCALVLTIAGIVRSLAAGTRRL
jgi:hypothetical protein